MQASPSFSTSGSLSWTVGTKCQPGSVLSATMQQSLPQRRDSGKDGTDTSDIEQQLQEERSRACHLQRQNDELGNKLSQLQHQHTQLGNDYASCQQVIRHHECELAEKSSIILQLQNRLARLQNLADAVAEEVHWCSTMMDPTPYLLPPSKGPAIKQAATGFAKPAVSNRDHIDHHDQLPTGHSQLPVADVSSGRLLQQQEQGSPALAGDAVSAGARLQPQAPTVGSKRSRLCSATGSAGAANPKRAASGGSGSSSSRQQLSEGEEPLDEGVGEVEPASCYANKRPHSPTESNLQLAAAAGEGQAAAAEQMEPADEDIEEKSQDDLEAAECLQALATSAAEVHDPVQHSPMMRMPSNPLSMDNLSSIMAAAARAMSSNQAPWANNSPAGGSSGGAINPMLMATLQTMLQGAAGGQGFDALSGLLSGKKGAPSSFVQPQPQMKQLPHQHHVVTAGPVGMRRPDGFTAGWGVAPKISPVSGGLAAPVRARKQSWFQTEIAEKIPVSVQQACAQDWASQQCMQVVCADLTGTFYVNSAGEYLIKLANSGEVVTPNKFEELAGKKTARNWQQSIRLIGYTMNGEPNSALLKLGHFTRIVGLVQDR